MVRPPPITSLAPTSPLPQPTADPQTIGALEQWERSLRTSPMMTPRMLEQELGHVRELRRGLGNYPSEGPTFDRSAHADATG